MYECIIILFNYALITPPPPQKKPQTTTTTNQPSKQTTENHILWTLIYLCVVFANNAILLQLEH